MKKYLVISLIVLAISVAEGNPTIISPSVTKDMPSSIDRIHQENNIKKEKEGEMIPEKIECDPKLSKQNSKDCLGKHKYLKNKNSPANSK